jgi:hypothetical protein
MCEKHINAKSFIPKSNNIEINNPPLVSNKRNDRMKTKNYTIYFNAL